MFVCKAAAALVGLQLTCSTSAGQIMTECLHLPEGNKFQQSDQVCYYIYGYSNIYNHTRRLTLLYLPCWRALCDQF